MVIHLDFINGKVWQCKCMSVGMGHACGVCTKPEWLEKMQECSTKSSQEG